MDGARPGKEGQEGKRLGQLELGWPEAMPVRRRVQSEQRQTACTRVELVGKRLNIHLMVKMRAAMFAGRARQMRTRQRMTPSLPRSREDDWC